MNQLDILAKLAQRPDISRLSIVADEGEECDLMFAREDAQKVIGAKSVASIGRIR